MASSKPGPSREVRQSAAMANVAAHSETYAAANFAPPLISEMSDVAPTRSGGSASFWWMDFSPCETIVLTPSSDGIPRVWSLPEARLLGRALGTRSWSHSGSMHPTQPVAVTVDGAGVVAEHRF